MALAIGLGCFLLAVNAAVRGGPERGLAFPLVLFGGVALAAAEGDRRLLSGGALRGAARLKRHLWRMCFAMFIASIAFYLGPDRVPSFMRAPALRGLGVLLPMIAMSYWMWKLRTRRVAGRVAIGIPEAA